jgi:hypothetical protein
LINVCLESTEIFINKKRNKNIVKPLSNLNKTKLHQFRRIIKEIVEVGIKIDSRNKSGSYKEYLFVRVNLFQRFIRRLEAINILLEHLETNISIEDSIGLIIRSGLIDFLQMTYLDLLHVKFEGEKTEENEIKLSKQTRNYLAEHIRTVIGFMNDYKYFDKFPDSIKGDDKYKLGIDLLKKDYPAYFKDESIADYNKPYENFNFGKFPKNRELLKEILEFKPFDDLNVFIAYDGFHNYSKYEHFGVMTNRMQTQDTNRLMLNIFAYLHFLLLGAYMCCSHINTEIHNIETEVTEIKKLNKEYVDLLNLGIN